MVIKVGREGYAGKNMQRSVSKKHRKVGKKHRNGPGLAKLRKVQRKRMHKHRGKR